MKPYLMVKDLARETEELPVKPLSLAFNRETVKSLLFLSFNVLEKPGISTMPMTWFAYTSLPIRGNHVALLKENGIPKGQDHINGIEDFWSFAKHWLYQYRGIHQAYFPLYLKEVEWQFNQRIRI